MEEMYRVVLYDKAGEKAFTKMILTREQKIVVEFLKERGCLCPCEVQIFPDTDDWHKLDY